MQGKHQHHRPHHCANAMTLCTLEEAAKMLKFASKQGAFECEKRALRKMAAGLIARGIRPEDFGRGA